MSVATTFQIRVLGDGDTVARLLTALSGYVCRVRIADSAWVDYELHEIVSFRGDRALRAYRCVDGSPEGPQVFLPLDQIEAVEVY